MDNLGTIPGMSLAWGSVWEAAVRESRSGAAWDGCSPRICVLLCSQPACYGHKQGGKCCLTGIFLSLWIGKKGLIVLERVFLSGVVLVNNFS